MRVLVVGLGSIGLRHSKNLKAIDPLIRVAAWTKSGFSREVGPQIDQLFADEASALAFKPDVAFITGPASTHVDRGLRLAGIGAHIFVEKPVSDRWDGVDELISLCGRNSVAFMTGYVFRFHRPLQILRDAVLSGRIGRPLMFRAEVGQYLPDWRPGRDYRETVSAQRNLGGGALLELSHEVDYARWIMGEVSSVMSWTGNLSDLEIDVEDSAEILVEFESGAMGSIHLDMIQHRGVRCCRVVGTEGAVSWDSSCDSVRLEGIGDGPDEELCSSVKVDRNEMYMDEVRHFLQCIRDGKPPDVDGQEGASTLRVVLAARRSAQDDRRVAV